MDLSRVSCCSYPLRDASLEHALDVIAAAGFRKVDLLGRAPHLSLDPRECDPVAVKAAVRARRLEIANLGTYVGKGFATRQAAIQEKELEQVERAIDLAVFFGARSIRVSAGDDDPACLDRIVPWFRRAAEYAAARRVYMGFETHGGGISGQPALCAQLSAQVGSPFFGVLYDPSNVLEGGQDYRGALEAMRGHIVHVHLKDGRVTPQGYERTMIGQGQIDFAWIMRRLEGLGYEGHWALEYELSSPPPEEGLKQWYQAAVNL